MSFVSSVSIYQIQIQWNLGRVAAILSNKRTKVQFIFAQERHKSADLSCSRPYTWLEYFGGVCYAYLQSIMLILHVYGIFIYAQH